MQANIYVHIVLHMTVSYEFLKESLLSYSVVL